ncbi:AAA domain-containing protein [Dichomitus squalens]|nr:AAA domain-containing protein [Dichomitus squalens]
MSSPNLDGPAPSVSAADHAGSLVFGGQTISDTPNTDILAQLQAQSRAEDQGEQIAHTGTTGEIGLMSALESAGLAEDEYVNRDVLPSGQNVVLMLVGLIASGKTTFSQALERHFPKFRRCSQDDLGDRRSVEALVRRSLGEGLSVVIDRANFDESQRSTWINIAREFPGTAAWIIVFDTPYEVCAARLAERKDHPTITTPELGLQVLERFKLLYRSPSPHEGYSRILYLKPDDLPPPSELTAKDVRDTMRRLRNAPEVVWTDPPTGFGYGGCGARGGYSRGYRDSRDHRGGHPPRRAYTPQGAPSYRGDWAPRGGYRGAGAPQERARWNAHSRGFSPGRGPSTSGRAWSGRTTTAHGSSGDPQSGGSSRHYDYDRTERDWR